MRQDKTQEQLKNLIADSKEYFDLQKEYLRLTFAEQLTQLLGKIALAIVALLMGIAIIMFLGLALVHWVGEAIGNIGLCYAVLALFMAILLAIFHHNRRKWVFLPLARLMSQTFLVNSEEDTPQMEENNDERAE